MSVAIRNSGPGIAAEYLTRIFDRFYTTKSGPDATGTLHLPKIDWVQPTLEFLSPTFTEFLLFFVTLLLFIASWKELRRAMKQ